MNQTKQMQRSAIIANATIDFHTAIFPFIKEQKEQEQKEQEQKEQDQKEQDQKEQDKENIPPKKEPYVFSLFTKEEELSNMQFGLLEITIASTPILHHNQSIDMNIDVSGSMSDVCKDGKSKIEHIKHTSTNIIKTISKEADKTNITFSIAKFDHEVEEVIVNKKITQENFQSIKSPIHDLEPRGSTNIDLAISKQATRSQKRYNESIIPIIQTNITLTDGLSNIGEKDYDKIAQHISPLATNIFIGYGKDHDSTGLQKLADKIVNGNYYYISEIEQAYIVFGEILNAILYCALKQITIKVKNGKIYNYKTNTWSTTLTVDSLSGESTRQFHLKSINPRNVTVKIFATSIIHGETEPTLLLDDLDEIPALNFENSDETEVKDLTIYLLRQKTQELLYKAHQQNMEDIDENKNYLFSKVNQSHILKQQKLKTEILSFCNFMKQNLEQNPQDVKNDEKINILIEDLQMIIKTFGSFRATMYSSARINSQGEQRSYNMNTIEQTDIYEQHGNNNQNILRHHYKNPRTSYMDIVDDIGFAPTPLTCIRSLTQTNTSPRQLTLMRNLSEGCSIVVNELMKKKEDEKKEDEKKEDEELPSPPLPSFTRETSADYA